MDLIKSDIEKCDSTTTPCECPVCLGLILDSDVSVRLSCFTTHFFHRDCLKKTAYHCRNYNCPLCKKPYQASIVDYVLDEYYNDDDDDEYYDDDDEYYDDEYDYFDRYLEDDIDNYGCVIPFENGYREDYGHGAIFARYDDE